MKYNKDHYILGTCLSHNGASCLIRNGKIIVAIEKERLTRIKHDGGADSDTVKYCLDSANISVEDLDLVVQNVCQHNFPYGNVQWMGSRYKGEEERLFLRNVKKKKIMHISHHLAHAFSAFAVSPFNDAAIIVIDGGGSYYKDVIDSHPCRNNSFSEYDMEAESYYYGKGDSITTINKTFGKTSDTLLYPLSILWAGGLGGLYAGLTAYVFGNPLDGGKLMGLAPYGKDNVFDFKMINKKNGGIKINKDWIHKFSHFNDWGNNKKEYKNLAYKAQKELEEALIYIANWLHKKTNSKNLCIAGGVGLNSVANKKILDNSPYENIFIQPAAHDAGIAIGCAYYGWLKVLRKSRNFVMQNCFLGKRYTNQEIRKILKKEPTISFKFIRNIPLITAQLLAKGKIVGWFQGGSEFGPRALGHRSILCDPRKKEIKKILNNRVKHRESFRPYAPSILQEDTKEYFELDCQSPFMLLVAKVKEEKLNRIPAVTHIDGTARIQTVNKSDNKIFYALIQEFKKITGIPVVLNTSLNSVGEPIVETPKDALDLYLSSQMDYIVMGNYLIEKKIFSYEDLLELKPYINENLKINSFRFSDRGLLSKEKIIATFEKDANDQIPWKKGTWRVFTKSPNETIELSDLEKQILELCNSKRTIQKIISILATKNYESDFLSCFKKLNKKRIIRLNS
ncbi:MAG: carbamoyltransferase [Promethearchaeota archaeon]